MRSAGRSTRSTPHDLWGNPTVNSGGGAWYPPAIDPERGLVYWGVANPAPFPGHAEFPNGSSRPGPNLYTDSAVALDLGTGALRWYHQVHPHDLFDRDLVHTMLVRSPTVTTRSSSPPARAAWSSASIPTTGELLWETPVGEHDNDDLTELAGPTEVLPGTYGGVLTPPAAADGVVYVPVVNAPSDAGAGRDRLLRRRARYSVDGEVVAIDAATGKVLWSTKVPGDPLGGATVVNDLVITALFDGESWRSTAPAERSSGR